MYQVTDAFNLPTDDQIVVNGPNEASPVWHLEPPAGRHVLLLGDVMNGGIGYAAGIDELEEFALRILALVRGAANKCHTCGEHIADPHAPWCPEGMDD